MKTTTEGLYPFAASPTEPVDFNEFENIVSVSGGKDSTATLLCAIEMGVPNLSLLRQAKTLRMQQKTKTLFQLTATVLCLLLNGL